MLLLPFSIRERKCIGFSCFLTGSVTERDLLELKTEYFKCYEPSQDWVREGEDSHLGTQLVGLLCVN